jgi:ABC-type Fe3+-hydroxamate transport system substrate-binding protein
MMRVRDDRHRTLEFAAPPRRVVSLVPSLTETLFALGCGDAVVGVTRFCEEPAAHVARVPKVGGTKNPDCAAIAALVPDLVIVNVEENRREDFERLEAMGLRTFVTAPASLRDTVDLLRRLGEVMGRRQRGDAMADELQAAIAAVPEQVSARPRVFCPIWKNPWMTVAGGTYADDMLATAGGENLFRTAAMPYPTITLDEVARRAPDVILLPSEPYRFSPRDERDLSPLAATPALRCGRVHFVDGKLLSWYGPRAAVGLRTFADLFRCRG